MKKAGEGRAWLLLFSGLCMAAGLTDRTWQDLLLVFAGWVVGIATVQLWRASHRQESSEDTAKIGGQGGKE